MLREYWSLARPAGATAPAEPVSQAIRSHSRQGVGFGHFRTELPHDRRRDFRRGVPTLRHRSADALHGAAGAHGERDDRSPRGLAHDTRPHRGNTCATLRSPNDDRPARDDAVDLNRGSRRMSRGGKGGAATLVLSVGAG